jgi:hypothetical protein
MVKSTTNQVVVTLQLGIGAKPIKKQLAALGLVAKSEMDCKAWQKIHESIWALYVHGYLSDAKKHSSLKKLYKEICRGVKIKEEPAKAKRLI